MLFWEGFGTFERWNLSRGSGSQGAGLVVDSHILLPSLALLPNLPRYKQAPAVTAATHLHLCAFSARVICNLDSVNQDEPLS